MYFIRILFLKKDSTWRIIVESDKEADANRNGSLFEKFDESEKILPEILTGMEKGRFDCYKTGARLERKI